MIDLSLTPCQQLNGAGPKTAALLSHLNIHTIQDLLFHLPYRYEDRTQIIPLRRLVPGEQAVIEGIIVSSGIPRQGKTRLLIELQDDSGGQLFIRFFYLAPFQQKMLQPNTRLRCFGEVRFGSRRLEMFHPEFMVIAKETPLELDQHLTPIYPLTEGLTQRLLRKLITQALQLLESGKASLPELIPADVLQVLTMPSLLAALQFVHHPSKETAIETLITGATPAQKRLAFEELLAHRLSLLHVKQTLQTQPAIVLTSQQKFSTPFLQQLPFKLTSAQQRVAQEVATDLSQVSPMLRLVQGDVGSGKTVVAVLAALQAVENNCQVAVMAPTEILVEQHFRVFQQWLTPLNIQVTLLSGNLRTKDRETRLAQIAQGEVSVVIGTHALFQKGGWSFNV